MMAVHAWRASSNAIDMKCSSTLDAACCKSMYESDMTHSVARLELEPKPFISVTAVLSSTAVPDGRGGVWWGAAG